MQNDTRALVNCETILVPGESASRLSEASCTLRDTWRKLAGESRSCQANADIRQTHVSCRRCSSVLHQAREDAHSRDVDEASCSPSHRATPRMLSHQLQS
eukprot:768456-Hanusia_phi.AAC.3